MKFDGQIRELKDVPIRETKEAVAAIGVSFCEELEESEELEASCRQRNILTFFYNKETEKLYLFVEAKEEMIQNGLGVWGDYELRITSESAPRLMQ